MPTLMDTYIENRERVQPNHANNYETAHGRIVMKWMDEIGGDVGDATRGGDVRHRQRGPDGLPTTDSRRGYHGHPIVRLRHGTRHASPYRTIYGPFRVPKTNDCGLFSVELLPVDLDLEVTRPTRNR